MRKAKILVLCTQNSCRSQMAEGLIRHIYGDRVEVFSAGAQPAENAHPLAIEALAARGIDISAAKPKNLNVFLEKTFDFVITTCDSARDSCPVFPGPHEKIHWGLEDPAKAKGLMDEIKEAFHKTADILESRIEELEEKIETINKSGD